MGEVLYYDPTRLIVMTSFPLINKVLQQSALVDELYQQSAVCVLFNYFVFNNNMLENVEG